MSYEDQGTGYDPGANGYERQGRKSKEENAMSKFTVVAPEGAKAKVRIQKQEEHVNTIPEVRSSTGELLALARTEKYSAWTDAGTDSFATGSREYEIGPGQRLILEEG